MGKFRKNNSYTAAFKLKIVKYAEEHGNRAAEREWNISEKLIRDWRKSKHSLQETNVNRRAFRGPKHGIFPGIENELLSYVRVLRNDGCSISCEMLQRKAKEIAIQQNVPKEKFKASRGWLSRFMRRNDLTIRRRTSVCQKLPPDFTDKIILFQKYVIRLRQRMDYLLSAIGNADQTPVYFDMPRNTTIAEKGASSVSVCTSGNEKMRCTVMLGITADGNKLPPFVIFKRKTVPKGVKFPGGIHVRFQEKGWMDENMMKDWVRNVWNKRPGALFKKPAMLVLDSFRGHLVNDVKKELTDGKTDLVIIPGGLTSILQPLDVSVNKPFKDNIRRIYGDWMANGNKEKTPSGKIRRPSLELMCSWILQSWALITSDLISKSFKKTGISNALDGTEDEILWDDGDFSDTDTHYDSDTDAFSESDL